MNINSILKGLAGIIMVLAAPAEAQTNGQMSLGFCNHEINENNKIGRQGAGVIEAATLVPATSFSEYSDFKILGIDAALASRLNAEEMTVWVRLSPDGENLAEKTVTRGGTPDLLKGWNSVSFDSPLPIAEDFYMGYTLRMKGNGYPVAIGGNSREGGLFLNTDGEWVDKSAEYEGTLSVEAIFTASNLPEYDLALISVDAPAFIRTGKPTHIPLTVKNMASQTVTEFDVEYSFTGANTGVYHVSEPVLPGQIKTIPAEVYAEAPARILGTEAVFALTNLKEGTDLNQSDNSVSEIIDIVTHDFTRRVLVEEFTTEKCVNCPHASETLHSVLEEEKYADSVIALCHHSGFGTDFLTTEADSEMVWIYGGGSFCPALMIDRTSSNRTPVRNFPEADVLMDLIDERLLIAASSAIEISPVFSEASGELQVNVSGGRYGEFGDTPLRLTVCLVENNVEPQRQKGASDSFMHQHVMRACNSTWGDPIEWDENDDYSYSCNFSIDKGWNRDNLHVIAFINEYDPEDQALCKVDNVARAAISWNTSSVDDIPAGSPVVTEYYDLNGFRIDADTRGFRIRVDIDASGRRTFTKEIF